VEGTPHGPCKLLALSPFHHEHHHSRPHSFFPASLSEPTISKAGISRVNKPSSITINHPQPSIIPQPIQLYHSTDVQRAYFRLIDSSSWQTKFHQCPRTQTEMPISCNRKLGLHVLSSLDHLPPLALEQLPRSTSKAQMALVMDHRLVAPLYLLQWEDWILHEAGPDFLAQTPTLWTSTIMLQAPVHQFTLRFISVLLLDHHP
jgi:hypothetical protein